ncbi:efflux RND transporter periplasmic adaptor subunit [Persicitalea jodogahamensis]|uniref:MexH family multidrug efflux RND transporter periplasmic adaptor subunit n=1 Tax=Persicitalea jodogahamensis TaxID=402147 RepID=A0A8J3DCW4_9BACT|nr:efflux RND transporter periplasmic adaptor subunit [Persicitalea jodogahamensis]GHB77878.1 MexH family multidrug efflux RND transporter periplasmic adaptor subunit [Persicitalea jodogahamensis]
MNKPTKRLITVLIVVMLLGLVFYPRLKEFFNKPDQTEASADAPKKGSGGKTVVSVMVVQPSSLDDVVKTTGSILANEEVEIRSEVSGKITQLLFKEGQYVQKGATLLKIYDDDLQAQLQKLEYAKKLSEDNEFRQRRLLEKEAISQREYDISLTTVKTNQADIDNIKAQLTRTTIKAPFSGRLGLRYISEGSYVTPTSRITTLTNTNPAKVEFSVPAKYADRIRTGSMITYTTESSDVEHTGRVYAVDPKIDPQTRTLQMRATSPNGNGALLPGAFARIELVTGSKGAAITVPNEAVVPEQEGHKVFLVKDGKATPREVKVGVRGEAQMEILGGLAAGDTLITTGILQVKPGGSVEIRETIRDKVKAAL